VEGVRLIEVKEDILADNIKIADGVRQRLSKTKTMLLNLMSSPGSGKTSLILKTVEGLKDSIKLRSSAAAKQYKDYASQSHVLSRFGQDQPHPENGGRPEKQHKTRRNRSGY